MMNRLRESRWAYILLSILLAFVFWYYVRAELDPSQPTWFRDVEVEIVNGSVLTRQGLTVSELSQDTVDLYIEAPASIREALTETARRLPLTVDVSRCVEGENKLSYDISWPESVNVENNNNVAVLERDPSVITVTVDKLYTQTFDVEVPAERVGGNWASQAESASAQSGDGNRQRIGGSGKSGCQGRSYSGRGGAGRALCRRSASDSAGWRR